MGWTWDPWTWSPGATARHANLQQLEHRVGGLTTAREGDSHSWGIKSTSSTGWISYLPRSMAVDCYTTDDFQLSWERVAWGARQKSEASPLGLSRGTYCRKMAVTLPGTTTPCSRQRVAPGCSNQSHRLQCLQHRLNRLNICPIVKPWAYR